MLLHSLRPRGLHYLLPSQAGDSAVTGWTGNSRHGKAVAWAQQANGVNCAPLACGDVKTGRLFCLDRRAGTHVRRSLFFHRYLALALPRILLPRALPDGCLLLRRTCTLSAAHYAAHLPPAALTLRCLYRHHAAHRCHITHRLDRGLVADGLMLRPFAAPRRSSQTLRHFFALFACLPAAGTAARGRASRYLRHNAACALRSLAWRRASAFQDKDNTFSAGRHSVWAFDMDVCWAVGRCYFIFKTVAHRALNAQRATWYSLYYRPLTPAAAFGWDLIPWGAFVQTPSHHRYVGQWRCGRPLRSIAWRTAALLATVCAVCALSRPGCAGRTVLP